MPFAAARDAGCAPADGPPRPRGACGSSRAKFPMPSYADDPRPGWPFPFPDGEPPPFPAAELDADVAALRRLLSG